MTVFSRVLVGTLAWGVLAFGAVYPWAYWPLAAGAAGLGLWAIVRTEALRDPRTRTLALVLTLPGLAMAAQLVPLPYGLVTRVSPGMDHFLREYLLAYTKPAHHPLSIDPGLTAVAFSLYAALALLLVGLTRAIRYVRLDWLMLQITGLGVGLAIVGVIQKALLDPVNPLVYGFWRPIYGGNPFGPFINRNHYAGWAVMTLPLVVGFAAAVFESTPHPRVASWRLWLRWALTVEANRFMLVAFTAIAMAMSVVLTGSRSGIASFGVVGLVMTYFVLQRAAPGRARIVAAGGGAVVLAGAVLWAGLGETVGRFLRTSSDLEGRFAAWRDSWQIMQDFPWFGTGLGTYGQSMLVYQTAGREEIYLQAHNDYVQVAAEGGLLLVVPAAILLTYIIRTIWRRMRGGDDSVLSGWLRAGAVAGLVGIAAQSLVEFSLQMPGNAVWFVLLAAIAMHRPSRSSSARRV